MTAVLRILLLILSVSGTAAPAAACTSSDGGLTVFAAASLRGAFQDIGDAYRAEHPGARVTFVFDGSDRLRLQLEQGARADVFASADTRQMDLAREAGLLAGEPEIFGGNRPAVVVPEGNPAGVRSARDLAKPGVRVVLAAPEVPAGAYARDLLSLLEGTYGAGYAEGVTNNVASHEQNVKAVLSKVALGEADAGIVYASDVTDDVLEIDVPEAGRIHARYPIAVLRESGRTAEAEAFVEFILSGRGQEILARHGFVPAGKIDDAAAADGR